MLSWTSFDIMADLTFGQDLSLLYNAEYSSWILSAFDFMRIFAVMRIGRHFPFINGLSMWLVPASVRDGAQEHFRLSADAVDRRLRKETTRPDIWSLVLSQRAANMLTRAQMHSNAELFMLAGTETTATLLSGLTYYLCRSPWVLQRLTKEIRGAFAHRAIMTLDHLAHLKVRFFFHATMIRANEDQYLSACLNEGSQSITCLGCHHLTS